MRTLSFAIFSGSARSACKRPILSKSNPQRSMRRWWLHRGCGFGPPPLIASERVLHNWQEKVELTAERERLTADRAREAPTVQQLEVETAQLQARIDELNKRQMQIKDESHKVKQDMQHVVDQAQALKMEITNLRIENGRLKCVSAQKSSIFSSN